MGILNRTAIMNTFKEKNILVRVRITTALTKLHWLHMEFRNLAILALHLYRPLPCLLPVLLNSDCVRSQATKMPRDANQIKTFLICASYTARHGTARNVNAALDCHLLGLPALC
jgi:hypothetical protein